MTKQESLPPQGSDQTSQNSSGDMTTHGEIHKNTMAGGSASLSLDSGLTSALSRAPSPFAGSPSSPASQAEQQASQAAYSKGAYQGETPPTTDYPQEPHFGQTPQHSSSHHQYEPAMDDIYNQEHHADSHEGYPHEAAPGQYEPVTSPTPYDHYDQGMNDVFDEANEKPHTRRTSFILLAALAVVAVIAGGVIYFYKSQTSDVASNKSVPVIKAEESPTKISPEQPGGINIPHQKKLIYDRITGENTQGSEQIVSREESVAPVTSAPQTGNPFDQQQQQAAAPDQPVMAPSDSEPKARAVLPPSIQQPPASPAPVAIAPQTSAPAATSSSGNYLIQIASFRTQEEAIRNYEQLSRRYAGLLSPYGPMIQKADLGSRGIYYRLRIGPMDSKQTAQNLCSNLVAQGQKDCLVRRK